LGSGLRAATAQALQTATAPGRPAGWQFSRSGAEVIEAARGARAGGAESSVDLPRTAGVERGVGPNEQGR